MRVLSLNTGGIAPLQTKRGTVDSGIVKRPVPGRVRVGDLGFDGDAQADQRVHGGPDKAVYAFPHEHYAWYGERLGRTLPHGFFGENLTIEELLEADVRIGERLAIGSAILEVRAPRQPCFKFTARAAEPRAGRWMVDSGRSGFYLAVIAGGEIGAGDTIARAAGGEPWVTIAEANDILYDRKPVPGLRGA